MRHGRQPAPHRQPFALRGAQLAEADEVRARLCDRVGELLVVHDELMIVDPRLPIRGQRPYLGRVDHRLHVHLGDARLQGRQRPLDSLTASRLVRRREVVGEEHAFFGREAPEREARRRLGVRARQPDRQPELDGELEVDVEELGPELHRPEMRQRDG